jgi:hypothetical protein
VLSITGRHIISKLKDIGPLAIPLGLGMPLDKKTEGRNPGVRRPILQRNRRIRKAVPQRILHPARGYPVGENHAHRAAVVVIGCGEGVDIWLIASHRRGDPSRNRSEQIGIVRATPDAHALISHWLSGLLAFVFWAAVLMSAIYKYVDVVERNTELGILRILGASYKYFFVLLLQETVLFTAVGALPGLFFAYIGGELFELAEGFDSLPLDSWDCGYRCSASIPGCAVCTTEGDRCGDKSDVVRAGALCYICSSPNYGRP